MKRLPWLLTAACAAVLIQAAEPAVKFVLPAETARLKAAPGVELANVQCVACHSLDYISTQPLLTSAQWRATVIKMQLKYGAPIMTNTMDLLVEYLARHYGTNTAAGVPKAR